MPPCTRGPACALAGCGRTPREGISSEVGSDARRETAGILAVFRGLATPQTSPDRSKGAPIGFFRSLLAMTRSDQQCAQQRAQRGAQRGDAPGFVDRTWLERAFGIAQPVLVGLRQLNA